MNSSIVVALIGSFGSVLAVIITSISNNRKIENKLDKQQVVTEIKLEELTREVREHNNFAKRMPVVEEQIKVINHRLEDLESELKK